MRNLKHESVFYFFHLVRFFFGRFIYSLSTPFSIKVIQEIVFHVCILIYRQCGHGVWILFFGFVYLSDSFIRNVITVSSVNFFLCKHCIRKLFKLTFMEREFWIWHRWAIEFDTRIYFFQVPFSCLLIKFMLSWLKCLIYNNYTLGSIWRVNFTTFQSITEQELCLYILNKHNLIKQCSTNWIISNLCSFNSNI